MSKIRTFYALLKTNLRSISRNRTAFFFTILFPLCFVGVFGLAFQWSDPLTSSKIIGIINYDTGIDDGVIAFWNGTTTVNDTFYSEEYIRVLETVLYPESNVTIFDIQIFNITELDIAQESLETRKIKALVTLPENFSSGVLAAFQNKYGDDPILTAATGNWSGYPSLDFKTIVKVDGDSTLQDFTIAGTIIEKITQYFFNFGDDPVEGVIIDVYGSLSTTGFTVFDFVLPGLIVYAILNNLASITDIAFNDIEKGTLRRLRISKVTPPMYILSILASQMVIAFIQIPLTFATGLIFGFPASIQVLYAFIPAIFLSLATSGIGLIFAGLVRNAAAGRGLAGIAATPIALISGAFFEIPNPTIISNIFGNSFGLYDILPAAPAIRIFRSLLLHNNSLASNAFDLILLFILAIVFLLIGLYLYSRKHFKPE